MSAFDAVDTFAGPGGWTTGLAAVGLRDVSLEWDAAACATRAAAGWPTIRADVSAYDPARFAGLAGFIGSPPCQTFSLAGNGSGRDLLETLRFAQVDVWNGASHADLGLSDDVRDRLVLEPARWISTLRPEWILLEQVPAVLPLWEDLADLLTAAGYSAAAQVLNCADYGLPQTRRRAFLIASRVRTVRFPAATHAENPEPVLFGAELRPWVSMAEALGWDNGNFRFVPMDRWSGGIARDPDWPGKRPAPALSGDPRVPEPRTRNFAAGERQMAGAIRLQVDEAAALQSFPPDYPFAGSKSAQFRQVGDAVPPLIAAALALAVARGIEWADYLADQEAAA